MATFDVACAECGHEQAVEPAVLGTQVKCPKCKTVFVAEQGDAYGLADEPAPQVQDRRSTSAGSSAGPRPSGPAPARPAAKPTARKPEPPPRAETREERAQRERMEKWAEKLDQ